MCGVLGIAHAVSHIDQRPAIERGISLLRHRGPDDSGCEHIKVGGADVYLAQTRLSVIDLSADGHQPMHSSDGRYSIVFNGEIYNYIELRAELRGLGYLFKSATDTEVLLTAWRHWGATCLERLDGMFAFVVLDRKEKILHCVRDPFGIKPLYYYATSDDFYFASELPALRAIVPDDLVLDTSQAVRYLVTGKYDADTSTFFKNVRKVLPGYHMKISIKEGYLSLTENRWFCPSIQEQSNLSFGQASEELRHLFLQSVKRQLRSDVPLGAALSGGIDSSSIVCAVRHLEPDLPINSFSYIATGSSVNEEKWVDLVNERARINPHKVFVAPENSISDLTDFITTHGEPLGGMSYYAEFCVYRLAKQHGIKVMLDGHGADESVCGYNGYPEHRIRSLVERRQFGEALGFARRWGEWPGRGAGAARSAFFSGFMTGLNLDQRIVGLLKSFRRSDTTIDDLFIDSNSHSDFTKIAEMDYLRGRGLSYQLRHHLSQSSCPPQLRGADRSAMRRSIENRVPFLSPTLVSFLLKMPEHYLISDQGQTKHLFRSAMRGIVPDEILDRRDKIGYATPPGLRMTLTTSVKDELDSGLERIKFLNRDNVYKVLYSCDRTSVSLDGISWRLFNLLRWVEIFNVKTA